MADLQQQHSANLESRTTVPPTLQQLAHSALGFDETDTSNMAPLTPQYLETIDSEHVRQCSEDMANSTMHPHAPSQSSSGQIHLEGDSSCNTSANGNVQLGQNLDSSFQFDNNDYNDIYNLQQHMVYDAYQAPAVITHVTEHTYTANYPFPANAYMNQYVDQGLPYYNTTTHNMGVFNEQLSTYNYDDYNTLTTPSSILADQPLEFDGSSFAPQSLAFPAADDSFEFNGQSQKFEDAGLPSYIPEEYGNFQSFALQNNTVAPQVENATMVDEAGIKLLRSALNSRDLGEMAGPYTALPTGIDLTTIEILTFLPGMIYDFNFIERLMHGGWTNHMVTHAINVMRDWGYDLTGNRKKFSRTIVTSTTKRAMSVITGDSKWAEKRWRNDADSVMTPVTDYSASQFLASRLLQNKTDVLISRLAEGVRYFPGGEDRGTLTKVIELVLSQPELDRPLAELDTLIEYVNVVRYDLDKDQLCQARWSEDAAKTKVRFYDITNQYNLEGAIKPLGIKHTKGKGKSATAASTSKKTSKRKRSSDADGEDGKTPLPSKRTSSSAIADIRGVEYGEDAERPRPMKRLKK